MYTAVEIASYFINQGIKEGKPVTQMKLQKLLYFANGYVLAKSDGQRQLIKENFEAWDFGPVVPEIYHEFKLFGANPIIPENDMLRFINKERNFNVSPKITDEDRRILNDIWNSLKGFSGLDLSVITHSDGSAWKKVFKVGVRSTPIGNEDIINEIKPLIKEEGA